VTSTELI